MKPINDENFKKFTESGESIIQFSANWCGPCKVLSKTLDGMSQLSLPVGKVDIDKEQSLAAQNGIRSIPTLIFFRNGKEIGRTMGAKSASEINEFIKENSN